MKGESFLFFTPNVKMMSYANMTSIANNTLWESFKIPLKIKTTVVIQARNRLHEYLSQKWKLRPGVMETTVMSTLQRLRRVVLS